MSLQNPPPDQHKPGHTTPKSRLRSLLKSGFGALFGIQSNQQREQDFATGKPSDFIALGITMVVLLLLGMLWLVNSIIP